ncbi:shikimate kinase [Clostridium ganghwense]|uniref:Shikimate kinase n=1 Tax=Clostridium ganghwense TaxID=312089 RepID=A0ABT4CNH1_9CLOT|nr:shikimate kinase [Clostridium ganghwense]MCY6369988.1 shikimate kinase [Clostridium ganghwense]
MRDLDKNIVLIGMPGCGKSTIGKELAKELNMNFCDIDEYIVEKTGQSIPEIFKSGEAYFRQIESEVVEEVSRKCPQIIATGGGVVKNSENIQLLQSNGIVIFINRSIEKIFTDVDIFSRPLLISGKEKLYKLYEERYHLYKKYCNYEIINDGSIKDAKEKIISYLKEI